MITALNQRRLKKGVRLLVFLTLLLLSPPYSRVFAAVCRGGNYPGILSVGQTTLTEPTMTNAMFEGENENSAQVSSL